MRDPLRRVIGVAEGRADTVLLACGHVCVLEPGRRYDYPKRRHCFRCGDQEPTKNLTYAQKKFEFNMRGIQIVWKG